MSTGKNNPVSEHSLENGTDKSLGPICTTLFQSVLCTFVHRAVGKGRGMGDGGRQGAVGERGMINLEHAV